MEFTFVFNKPIWWLAQTVHIVLFKVFEIMTFDLILFPQDRSKTGVESKLVQKMHDSCLTCKTVPKYKNA